LEALQPPLAMEIMMKRVSRLKHRCLSMAARFGSPLRKFPSMHPRRNEETLTLGSSYFNWKTQAFHTRDSRASIGALARYSGPRRGAELRSDRRTLIYSVLLAKPVSPSGVCHLSLEPFHRTVVVRNQPGRTAVLCLAHATSPIYLMLVFPVVAPADMLTVQHHRRDVLVGCSLATAMAVPIAGWF